MKIVVDMAKKLDEALAAGDLITENYTHQMNFGYEILYFLPLCLQKVNYFFYNL